MLVAALALSILGLALGPALVAISRQRWTLAAALEGLTLGVVPTLVFTRLLPHLYDEAGVLAITLFVAGYAVVWLVDRHQHSTGERLGRAVVVPTLIIHAFTDGASLAVAVATARHGDQSGSLLGAALVLHRLPEGLFLASVLMPQIGWRRTSWRVAAIAASTVVGALAERTVLANAPDGLIHAIVAFGLGVMLRLVLHSHAAAPRTAHNRIASGIAFLVGTLGVLALPSPDDLLSRALPRELPMITSLVPLFVETAPAMLLGLVGAALVHAFAPHRPTAWLRASGPFAQAWRGVVFGVPLPLCACGVLPQLAQLVREGAPAAAVLAFAIGTPQLAIGAGWFVSVRMLGVEVTAVRLVATLAMALLVARAASPIAKAPRFRLGGTARRPLARVTATPSQFPAQARGPLRHRLVAALRDASTTTMVNSSAWYAVGLVVAALLEAGLRPEVVSGFHAPWDLAVAVVVAVPVYLGAEGITPIAAVLVHKGFPVGGALVLVLLAPTVHVGMLRTLKQVYGTAVAVRYAGTAIAVAVLTGALTDRFVSPRGVPAIHDLVGHRHAQVEWVIAAGLAGLLVLAVLRLGPREWFGTLGASGTGQRPMDTHAHAAPIPEQVATTA